VKHPPVGTAEPAHHPQGGTQVTIDSNIPGIEDDTRPNAGRVYDYFLGGNHNFDVDREVAAKLLQVYPILPKKLKMPDEGFTGFINFASGLPVQNHIHQIALSGTKVIYSEKDKYDQIDGPFYGAFFER
jgi:hypothetical protein